MKFPLIIKPYFFFFLISATTAFAQDGADPKPDEKDAYPANWGKPPMEQTADYTQLPGGYGMGSSTLGSWIAMNMVKDRIAGDKNKSVNVLDASADDCKKNEVSASLGGPTPTGIYYTFSDQKAVLVIRINNKNKDFPVSAKLHVFDDKVTEKGLSGWVNNQHSCALYPDVPNPIKTHQIPEASCKVTSNKLIEVTEIRNLEFENYTVAFQLKDIPLLGGIQLKDFTDQAKVYVRKN